MDRLAHGLQARKVDDAVDVVGGKDLGELLLVADIALDKLDGLARDCLDAVEHDRRGVAQVVKRDGLVPRVLQLDDGVASDEAGSAGNENLH